MKTVTKYIIALSGVSLAYAWYSVRNAVNNLALYLYGFSINGFNIERKEVSLLFSFGLYNPTRYAFLVTDMYADVYLNNQLIGSINSFVNTKLRSGNFSRFQILSTIDTQSASSEMLDLLLAGMPDNWRLTFVGHIIIDNKQIALNKTFLKSDLKQ